jgi:hypothetical protein
MSASEEEDIVSAEPIEEDEAGAELAEIVELDEDVEETALAQSSTLFGTDDPFEVISRASAVATALAEVVRKQKLANVIQGREFVKVEGWTLLGSMLGVFPVTVWTRELGSDEGWEARVEARTRDGQVVGAAEAECRRSEKTWAKRDSYALRSMAATRATSKAMRGPLGFVMTLAGFQSTPAEEIPPEPEIRHDGRKPLSIAQSNSEWLERMRQLEVREPEAWARSAAASSGLARTPLLQRLNRVLLDLTDGEHTFDPFGEDPDGTVVAAFAAAFDGLLIEPPPLGPAEPIPGQTSLEDPHAREEGAA